MDAMDAMEAILTRRSTRKMKPEIPPRELIEKILLAGKAAPSGHNNHTARFLVITSRKVLDDLAILVEKEFAAMNADEDTYASLRHSIKKKKKGGYVFHYHGPVLIVVADQKGYGNAMADSACALENMMLAAHALGLGSCWINQLHWLDEDPAVRSCLEGLGLSKEETITGALIVGYAAEDLSTRAPREPKGNPVLWIEDKKEEEA